MKRVPKTAWCIVLIAAMWVTFSCRSEGVAPVADGETDHFHPKGKPVGSINSKALPHSGFRGEFLVV